MKRWFLGIGLAVSGVAQAQSWTYGGGGTLYDSDDAACDALAEEVSPSYEMIDLEPAVQPGMFYCYYGPPGDDSHALYGTVWQTGETSSCEDLDGLSGRGLGEELLRRMTNAADLVNSKIAQHPRSIFSDQLPVHGDLSKWAHSPKLFPLAYGHVLEQMTAMAVARDRCLSRYVEHIPNREQNKPGGMPDFVGKGPAAGLKFDITTRGEMQRKKNDNPNKRKPGYLYVLYERQFEYGAVAR